ncbi:MAG: hypothetical protein HY317_03190 [Acidobacteria bacterium]|nr:hypothetical protein [Acidobacteriota bacterium]
MTTRPLSERERLALEGAARGCVSGTLAEWPELAGAFAVLGWKVPATIRAGAMRGLARAALAELHAPRLRIIGPGAVVDIPRNGREAAGKGGAA